MTLRPLRFVREHTAPTPVVPQLTDADIASHAALGITGELLASAGVRRVDDRAARELLTWSRPGSVAGIVYPYLHPTTKQERTYRVRRDHPEIENGKPKTKYVTAYGDRACLFFPPECSAALADINVQLVIVEAEKSVLALTCADIFAVGTGGCWGWRGRIGKTESANGERVDETGPLPDLDLIEWKGREVVIAFDSNAATNPKVQAARRALSKELAGRGAVVRTLDIPAEPGVNGPDDFIGKHGADAFLALLDAPPAPEVDARIAELNQRFAIISVGNRVVVMETRPDGGIKELWDFEEFKRLQIKERVTVGSGKGDTKHVPLAPLWLQHPSGRRYDQLVYAMPGSVMQCGPRDYNGWQGFRVKAAPGDWSLNRRHVLDIICGGVVNYFVWLFNWMAALVQQPGRHAMSAIVLRGGQGIGKGHFVHHMMGALFGAQQYLHILGANQLTAEFNEHLSGKVLIFADESTWGGDPKAASKLKGLVTEDTVPIHRKFLKMVEEPSALHIIIASNKDWPIPIDTDDRRFFVLDVSDAKRQDDAYFVPLRDELRNGGRAAMLHDLLAHNVDQHALRHPLKTDAKRDVTERSLEPIERWWLEKLKTGCVCVPYALDWNSGVVPKFELHADYLRFIDQHHRLDRQRRSTETELGQFLKKYAPGVRQAQTTDTNGNRQRVWYLPTLADCRAAWVAVAHWPAEYEWPEVEDADEPPF